VLYINEGIILTIKSCISSGIKGYQPKPFGGVKGLSGKLKKYPNFRIFSLRIITQDIIFKPFKKRFGGPENKPSKMVKGFGGATLLPLKASTPWIGLLFNVALLLFLKPGEAFGTGPINKMYGPRQYFGPQTSFRILARDIWNTVHFLGQTSSGK